MKNKKLPEWETLISAASRLQKILPDAVLVGGTAVGCFENHRLSYDADHILTNLKQNFDQVLADLESVSGWKTARIRKPVLILGSLDGIETGIRQLIRSEPLSYTTLTICDKEIQVPTLFELLRIKAILIIKRNSLRDFIDFTVMAEGLGLRKSFMALKRMDKLYPQENNAQVSLQLLTMLSDPSPFDLDDFSLADFKNLKEEWQDWDRIKEHCQSLSHYLSKNRILDKAPK